MMKQGRANLRVQAIVGEKVETVGRIIARESIEMVVGVMGPHSSKQHGRHHTSATNAHMDRLV